MTPAARIKCLALILLAGILPTPIVAEKVGEKFFPGFTPVQLICEPATSASDIELRISVREHWIRDNGLFVTLQIDNLGSRSAYLPSRNSAMESYTAVLLTASYEPIFYCGGVRDLSQESFSLDLLEAEDLTELKPGESVVLGPVDVAPFWPYLWDDKKPTPRHFRVIYQFYEPEWEIPDAVLEIYRERIRSAESVYCRLPRSPSFSQAIAIKKTDQR